MINKIKNSRDYHLFYDTVVAAARRAHIHNDIESFSGKYDTMIGERGVLLSFVIRAKLNTIYVEVICRKPN